MYFGSEIFYGLETVMTIAVWIFSLQEKEKQDNFVLDIQCTIIGKLTDFSVSRF